MLQPSIQLSTHAMGPSSVMKRGQVDTNIVYTYLIHILLEYVLRSERSLDDKDGCLFFFLCAQVAGVANVLRDSQGECARIIAPLFAFSLQPLHHTLIHINCMRTRIKTLVAPLLVPSAGLTPRSI